LDALVCIGGIRGEILGGPTDDLKSGLLLEVVGKVEGWSKGS